MKLSSKKRTKRLEKTYAGIVKALSKKRKIARLKKIKVKLPPKAKYFTGDYIHK